MDKAMAWALLASVARTETVTNGGLRARVPTAIATPTQMMLLFNQGKAASSSSIHGQTKTIFLLLDSRKN
jgi:hypothetical protein